MEDKEYNGDLILLRGIPGSGKTTLGEVILYWPTSTQSDVISADNYFINKKGEYFFESSKIKMAHNYCQQTCSERMRNGIIKIVVANTFTEEWEMETYFEMAKRYNYRIHTVIVENRHKGVNVHGVPEEKLEQMRNRFEVKL